MEKIINNLKKIKNIIVKLYDKNIGKIKKRKLKVNDFTIISNNCFGGNFYRKNAMPYLTPTCGLFFMGEEYIKFIYDLDKYLNGSLIEISIEKSKYRDYLKMIQYDGVLGKIDDLEICFLHYKDFKEASEKWNRRKERINKDKIIYKFNDQNLCNYELLKKFDEFDAKHKICFTAKKYPELNTIQLKKYKDNIFVLSDSKSNDYKSEFNMYKYINNSFKI